MECAYHLTDFFAWYDEFRGEIIQVNPETACAFGTHQGDGDVATALRIDFSFMTKWAKNLVFGHF